MSETAYQKGLVDKLGKMFPGSVIMENDPQQIQGLPDLLILYNDRWAMLEVKADKRSKDRPNQPYYVDLFNRMSFARFIYPQNETEVLNALQSAFKTSR